MALPVTNPWFARPPESKEAEDVVEALYIGADSVLADLYRLKLELDGYGVRMAFTGTEGLAQARKKIPDLMFIDLGRGDDSLLETHRVLRRDRDLKDVPAVLLWRGDTDAPTLKSLDLGVGDVLVQANGYHSAHIWGDLTSGRVPYGFAQ